MEYVGKLERKLCVKVLYKCEVSVNNWGRANDTHAWFV